MQEQSGLEVTFLKQSESYPKSDGIVLVDGAWVCLIDGGMDDGSSLRALEALRKKRGVERLPLDVLVSHCHPDHVNALVAHIVPCQDFLIEHVYLAQPTSLPTDGSYDNSKNSDIRERLALFDVLSVYQKQAMVVVLPFATKLTFRTLSSLCTLYAPVADWGSGERLKRVLHLYYQHAGEEERRKNVPTAVINANCMWIKMESQGVSFLFTGDSMKKTGSDESFDEMIDYYGAENLKSDVVKYPHHGQLRNPAAPRLKSDLLRDASSYSVVTGRGARAMACPVMDSLGMRFVDSSEKDVCFVASSQGLVLKEGV